MSSRSLLRTAGFALLLVNVLGLCNPLWAAEPVERRPVPDAAAQEKAAAIVQEIYGQQPRQTAEQRQALARKLLKQAQVTTDDPAARFVLLRIARDTAAGAGDLETSLQAAEAMASDFQVDLAAMTLEALQAAAKPSRFAAQAGPLVNAAMAAIDRALAEDGFEVAAQLANLALGTARKARDAALVKQATAAGARVESMRKAHAEVEAAMARLDADPTDAAANLAVGRYLCFLKGDWQRGISMLALGNDAALKALAVRELKGETDAEARLALGDGWWDYAEQQEGPARDQVRQHAAAWYRKVLPDLTGLAREKVRKRLEELENKEGKLEEVSATKLKLAGQCNPRRAEVYPIAVDKRNFFRDLVFPEPEIPGVKVEHTIFVHPIGFAAISLAELIRAGNAPQRFTAHLILSQGSREHGSDGIVWTVEMGTPKRMALLLTTEQSKDVNPVDLAIPKGATQIVIKAMPGAKGDVTSDWGVVVNPVVHYTAGRKTGSDK